METKIDANDEIDSVQKFVLNQMLHDESQYKKKYELQAIPWGQLNKMDFPVQRWRIKNLIPLEGFVILAGISGEGKSWSALEMAKCISSGENFLGEDGFPTEKGNVLYVDMEMPRFEIQRRSRQLQITGENLYLLSGDEFNLNDGIETDLQSLKYFIHDNNISVVFIDTFRAVAGGLKEERAEEVRTFFNRLKEFKDKGVVFVFLDHFRKPSRFEGKVPKKENLFSSQDKVASVEILLMLQKDEASEEINVYQRKNRLGLEIKPFKMIITDSIDSYGNTKTEIKFGGFIEDGETKKVQAKELIVRMLTEGGKTRKEILSLALEEKIGEKNTSDALREMEKSGEINSTKKGRENFYMKPNKDRQEKVDDFSNLFEQ